MSSFYNKFYQAVGLEKCSKTVTLALMMRLKDTGIDARQCREYHAETIVY